MTAQAALFDLSPSVASKPEPVADALALVDLDALDRIALLYTGTEKGNWSGIRFAMTAPGQDAQACPTCDADPSTAPGRYCASRRCLCAHDSCPAYPSWVPREGQSRVIHLPEPRAT